MERDEFKRLTDAIVAQPWGSTMTVTIVADLPLLGERTLYAVGYSVSGRGRMSVMGQVTSDGNDESAEIIDVPVGRIVSWADTAQMPLTPVLSVSHAGNCGVWRGHYSRATWDRCTCQAVDTARAGAR